jgi:hypothetical protein
MATTTRSRSAPSSNGRASTGAVAKAKDAGDAVTTAAKSAKAPLLAAGGAALGLAGGIVLESQRDKRRRGVRALVSPRRRKVLGVPIERKTGLQRTAETLGKAVHEFGSVSRQVSSATDEIRQVREQLDHANRQSPVEVLLDGLTHRRGAHKRES